MTLTWYKFDSEIDYPKVGVNLWFRIYIMYSFYSNNYVFIFKNIYCIDVYLTAFLYIIEINQL